MRTYVRFAKQKRNRPLPGGFNISFPNTPAILGSPTFCLANFREAFGNSSAILLGLGVTDFVEIHHNYLPLSFFFIVVGLQSNI
jgi:hypothetical protein